MYTLEDSFMLIKEDAASCNILWEERQAQVHIVVLFALLQREGRKVSSNSEGFCSSIL